jgi:hypothetical protein
MSGEMVRQQPPTLRDQMDFARALATADLLPPQFRGRPGDVLLAMELGRSLNLPVAQIFTSVNIIEGSPTISAELMQALVRRAGHRIRIQADNEQAQCTIWRTEDPDFAWISTFTMADARRAGLAEKRNWQRYPKPMLIARAVSACCRLACPDVLAGVSYTPEELGGQVVDAPTGSVQPPADVVLVDQAPAEPTQGVRTDKPFIGPNSEADNDPDTTDLAAQTGSGDKPFIARTPTGEQPPRNSGNEQFISTDSGIEVEVYRADWLGRLDQALETGDLPLVQQLGSEAANAGHGDLVDDARNAWAIIQGRTDDDQPPVEEATEERRVDERPADWRRRW